MKNKQADKKESPQKHSKLAGESTPDRPHNGARAGLIDRLFHPVDNASLVFFRIVFGGLMFWEATRYYRFGWIERYYVVPKFHFKYYGFEWIEPWPGLGMYWHFAAMAVFALAMMAGLLYRLSAALFFVAFTYVFLLEQASYLNHFYLISLLAFLMIFMPVNRALSVDAWLRPSMRTDTTPAWTLWLLRAQIGLVYFFAGLAKLNQDWLRGEPMRTWLRQRTEDVNFTSWLPASLLTHEFAAYFFSYGGLFLDLLITPMLLWRRTRMVGFLAAISFHALNHELFNIGVFPFLALAATTLFFSPDWPRSVLPWKRRVATADAENLENATATSPRRRLVAALLAGYMLVQVLVPLRHWLYPGDVNWTEEGHRFSWRMKLRSKSSSARFTISDPAGGRMWEADLSKFLNPHQRRKMVTRPDLILQFAHHLAREMENDGFPGVEVRAEVRTSLNGRSPELLIDPTVNLAAEPRTLRHVSWIPPLSDRTFGKEHGPGESEADTGEGE